MPLLQRGCLIEGNEFLGTPALRAGVDASSGYASSGHAGSGHAGSGYLHAQRSDSNDICIRMNVSTVALNWYTFHKKYLDIGADAGVNVKNRVGWGRIKFFLK